MSNFDASKLSEEDRNFAQFVFVLFERANRMIGELTPKNAHHFLAAAALLLKTYNRSAINVRTEWAIDPKLFAKDTCHQAGLLIQKVDEFAKKNGLTLDVPAGVFGRIYGSDEFAAYVEDFITAAMNTEDILEENFIGPE